MNKISIFVDGAKRGIARQALFLAVFLLLASLCSFGCGGSGASDSSGKQTGSFQLSIAWPVRTTRLIPTASNSITVSILNGSTVVASQTIPRPTTIGTSTVRMTSVPVGTFVLKSSAYPSTDGTGVAQATASQPVTIATGATTNAAITMGSTIVKFSIAPTTPVVAPGSTITLIGTALDAAGETVLTASSTISWASSNAAVATVTAAGVVTGVANGTALMTVTDSESGKTGAVSLTVSSYGTVLSMATAYIGSLTSSQQAASVVTSSAANAAKWSNLIATPGSGGTNSLRNGVAYSSLTAAQQTAFNNLVQAVLTTSGATEFTGIRDSDYYLNSLNSGYSGDYEYIGFVGTPSATGSWLLQLGGHNIAHNYYYANGVLATTTPYYLGVEPTSFTYNSTALTPMSAQQSGMLNLIGSLTTTQLASAQLSTTFSDLLLGPGKDARSNFPTGTTGRGILASSLTATQQTLLETAITAWTQTSSAASTYQSQYIADLPNTYVAYSGTTALTSAGDYVRIDGPHVWIEFLCVNGTVVTTQIAYRSVWRDRVSDYNAAFSF